MIEQDLRTTRTKRHESEKSGKPFGRFSAKHIRSRDAMIEAARQNSQHQGPKSSNNH
jgi:hypothetical protein